MDEVPPNCRDLDEFVPAAASTLLLPAELGAPAVAAGVPPVVGAVTGALVAGKYVVPPPLAEPPCAGARDAIVVAVLSVVVGIVATVPPDSGCS